MTSSPNILGIGTPFYDITRFVDDAHLTSIGLEKGKTIVGDTFSHTGEVQGSLGGSCANVLKVLGRTGLPCAIHGVIGDCTIGKNVVGLLEKSSVRPLLQMIENKNAGIVTCYVTPDAERTMHVSLGAIAQFSEQHLVPEHFKGVSHVHIEGYSAYSGKVLEETVKQAKKSQSTISIDLASPYVIEKHRDALMEGIDKADYIFGNKQEMLSLTGQRNIRDALTESFDLTQTVVATDGPNGCYVRKFGSSTVVHYNAHKVNEPLDTTGAGDFFCGGFLSGALRGKGTPLCVQMGNIFASAVIQQQGAELPEERWAELLEQIRSWM